MGVAAKKLEPVATPAEESRAALQAAVQALQAENEKLAEIGARAERVRALDQGAIEAQTAVNELAAAQTAKIQAWAAAGAKGGMPTTDEDAVRHAAQRLESAMFRRQSAQTAQQMIEAEYADQVRAIEAADTAVKIAAANVLGPEALAKYQRYRAMLADVLLIETEVNAEKQRLLGLQLRNAAAFGGALGQKFYTDFFTPEETADRHCRAQANEAARWEALLRGEV